MKIEPTGLYTHPDVAVLCGKPRWVDPKGECWANPTAIVEVLSASTEAYDRGAKFEQYQSISSLATYLLIDEDGPRVEQFIRKTNTEWDYRITHGIEPPLSISASVPRAGSHGEQRLPGFPDAQQSHPFRAASLNDKVSSIKSGSVKNLTSPNTNSRNASKSTVILRSISKPSPLRSPHISKMNDGRFAHQTAIVTGGTSGLGRAITKRLQAEGAFVAVLDCNAKAFDKLAEEFGARGACQEVDCTNEASVRAAVERVSAERGRIDILVNSAGVTGKTNIKSHEVDLADFEFVMRTNVYASFLTSKYVLPPMVRQNYGRVLHIASISGKEGNAGMLAYSTSKAAVIGMTKVQGKEYAETGVTINALAPAVIQTAMVAALPEAQVKYMTDKIPMKRCGKLEEVAAMAAFIVSPEASFTTGFTFDLTGGRAVY